MNEPVDILAAIRYLDPKPEPPDPVKIIRGGIEADKDATQMRTELMARKVNESTLREDLRNQRGAFVRALIVGAVVVIVLLAWRVW